ncbi:MAG TPA: type II toxin-antitoxin system HicA family toxin [Planctomycetota bacterium]|jgi:predicted RNA binding protein YcfA (HicA-like mRNA interferase family)
MPPFGPIQRADLIRNLGALGFSGPFAGGRHQFMRKDSVKLILPNPHRGAISKPFLARLLRQAGISRERWEKL